MIAAGLVALVQGILAGDVDISDPSDGYMVEMSEVMGMGSVIWVDARSADAYREDHVTAAIHLSEDDWDSGLASILETWDFEQPLVVYCDGGDCSSSKAFARRLRQDTGTEGIFWLKGGWKVLQEAGLK